MTELSPLLELAERCEKATGPELAIDYDIAEFVTRAHMATGKAPKYTASLDAAMTLVPEGWDRNVGTKRGKPYAYLNNGEMHFVGVAARPNPDRKSVEVNAATEALALCAAALRAQSQEPR